MLAAHWRVLPSPKYDKQSSRGLYNAVLLEMIIIFPDLACLIQDQLNRPNDLQIEIKLIDIYQ